MSSSSLPSVTFVLVNYNGKHHLEDCLPSLYSQRYPSDRVEVMVVDNGSSDGSVDWLEAQYPQVRILRNPENAGFAPAVNQGVEAATTDVVALVNNDMYLDDRWLEETIAKLDGDAGVVAVAGLILDWHGERVDFHDAAVTFYGLGLQPGHGLPSSLARVDDGADLLFGCGGSLLIQRDVFAQIGGFDPSYFAYYEDVDLGWRLRILGYRTVLAANAISHHRHHGTSATMPVHERARLLERNALRTVIKNYDDENLRRILGPALLLAVTRAADQLNLEARELTSDAYVSQNSLSPILAIRDIVAELPSLMCRRREIQLRRVTPDAEILPLFGHPTRSVLTSLDATQQDLDEFAEAVDTVATEFRVDELFSRVPGRTFVVMAYEQIGEKMAGPAIRSWEIACALAGFGEVIVASPHPIGRVAEGVTALHFKGEHQLRAVIESADVVLMFGHELVRHPWLRDVAAVKIVDLYDPWTFEHLEQLATGSLDLSNDHHALREADVLNDLADSGDFFICASERQRDYWLGMLTSRGRVDRAQYRSDPMLRSLIDVVPYGCPSDPPQPVDLRSLYPELAPDAFVVLWSGGVWDWFDPVTVVEAVARARESDPRIVLCFMGLQLDDRGVPTMRNARAVWDRVRELGLDDGGVILGPWVPYDDRGGYLAAADVAVIATKQVAEVRYSYRSRVLDHFWAGLPTITTGGDVMSNDLLDAGAGIAVPPGDVDTLAAVLLDLSGHPARVDELSVKAKSLAETATWEKNVAPLRNVQRAPWRIRELRSARSRPLAMSEEALRRARVRADEIRIAPSFGISSRRRALLGKMKNGRIGSSRLFPILRRMRRSGLGRRILGVPTDR